MAKEKLDEIGAANCLAKFKNHYGPDGEGSTNVYTPRGWQAKFEKWVLDERPPSFATAVSQQTLPLMRDATGKPQPRGWQPGMPTDEEMRKRYGGANG
jgi:hypothetical protein